VLTTLMMPFEALVIPLFVMFSAAGLAHTYAGLILPGLSSVFGVFLFRQFFLGLPRDLEDAARIDGCSRWGVFWRIACRWLARRWWRWPSSTSWATGTTSSGP
jgi:ABC-type glycerol-3-phosphate transport system permease component